MTRTPGEDKQEEIQQQQKIGKENEKQNHKLWENNKPMPAKNYSPSLAPIRWVSRDWLF